MTSREPLEIVEIDMDFCTRTYGNSPCAAVLGTTGVRKCYNTFATCQDTANYNKGALTLRFAKNQHGLPKGQTIFPALQSVSTNSQRLNVAGGDDNTGPLGRRERVTVALKDFSYQDTLTDKYQAERVDGTAQTDEGGYNPLDRGSFFGKIKTRNPFYYGRPLRVLSGYVGDALASMRTKHYVIEEWSGPDVSGNVSIVARDILSLADNEKALCPRPSNGKLKDNITDANGETFRLVPSGVGSEYPASGKASIGSEIVSYTRSGDRITLTRRAEGGSERASHSEGDTFQEAYETTGKLLSEAVEDLLVNYGNVDASFIDTTAWNLEASRWLPGLSVGTIIPKPTGVLTLLNELSQLGAYIWWDAEDQEVRFELNKYIDIDASVVSLTDDRNFLRGSMSVEDRPESWLSQVFVYYLPVNYAASMSEPENFKVAEGAVDLAAEGANQYDQSRNKIIYSRWIEDGSQQAARQLALRILGRYSQIPTNVTFDVDASDIPNVELASLLEITTRLIQNETGGATPTQVQVIEFEETMPGHRARVTVQAVAFTIKLGYWMNTGANVYGSATDAEKRDGAYWAADATGFPDGAAPYQWG